MMRTTILKITFLLALMPSLLFAQEIDLQNKENRQPNILIILADDMGYGDLGCMGSKVIKSPNIDRLAEKGIMFTSAYVTASVCAPSRAGLLTGRFPHRFGFEDNLNHWNEDSPSQEKFHGLNPSELTIADHLKKAGYQTALIGKWHLGSADVHHPNNRGFDYFCGMIGGGHNYFLDENKNHLERNGLPITSFSNDYITDFFTDEALQWIEDKKDTTWFLFMSYNAPHTPMQAKEEDLKAFPHIKDKGRRTYAAMVQALDRGVGEIIQKLKDEGLYENTLVVFFSDNGGATINHSWNGPLSGCKGNCREGGIRVPMIWQWPDQIPANKRNNAVVSSLDLLPSFLSAAGTLPIEAMDKSGNKEVPRTYDGINILPLIKGEQQASPRRLFWRLQGQAAILDGKDKLIRLSHKPAEYFRPIDDIGEGEDLSKKNSERYSELYELLFNWEVTLPTNPHFSTSPYWKGESAKNYESWKPKPEIK
ncbi:MAG: arylsulfatase [Bacteroidetes bacterium]|nr:MAG: arylsulfatase [Bacteroidota bacterium]